ncbi:MAG TPA: dephospho-CoA kinase [Candidatus Nanoarchaeia archaeon]|nr:dephospho-CoA kinase [Candidatus Nanoarchaeia archaeon]
MIIGITGTIGSGKTAASDLFKKYGFKVINADELYHKISKPNKIIYKKIIKEFGNKIINSDKSINRDKLKKIVFSDDKKLKKLNLITHPIINSEIKKLIKKFKNSKVIVDAPLLLESDSRKLVGKIVVVKCDDKARIRRLLKKGKLTKEQINKITKFQMPMEKKLKFADFVIDNSKDLKNLENQVKSIVNKLNQ